MDCLAGSSHGSASKIHTVKLANGRPLNHVDACWTAPAVGHLPFPWDFATVRAYVPAKIMMAETTVKATNFSISGICPLKG